MHLLIWLLYFFVNFVVLTLFIQSVREEEKEVYRQLLNMVSGGQSSCLHNGSSHAFVRSHRDLYVSIQSWNASTAYSIANETFNGSQSKEAQKREHFQKPSQACGGPQKHTNIAVAFYQKILVFLSNAHSA